VKVFEETGHDVSGSINDREFIEINFGEQKIRLYVVRDVSLDTVFEPKTRKEISVRMFHFSEMHCFPIIGRCRGCE
jgi:mRNA-decapping enzyme subunit 2